MAGHPRNIDSPIQLWELFEEYQSKLETILVPQSHVKLGVIHLEIKEPMSMEGFKDYCYDEVGCIKRYIDGSLEINKEEYVTIISRIKDRIFSHNLSRAAVGLYKENLIARQLGMTEKTDNKNENTNIEIKANFGGTTLPTTSEPE